MSASITSGNPADWPIWGHDYVVRDLVAAAIRGPRHAYIFAGFEHLGKRTAAITFAQALMCSAPPSPGVPCRSCRNCARIARGTHPDVSEWNLQRQQAAAEKASTSKNLSLNIATVRDISASLAMRPFESTYRVIIVDDVETMQETAKEAFLKTLEEPPPYAVILLLTTDAEILLETIRSRAATVQFQPVQEFIIASGLEARGIESALAHEISQMSEGRPGWAILASQNPPMLDDRRLRTEEARRWIEADRYNQLIEATKLGEAFSKDRESVFVRLSALQHAWRHDLTSGLEAADLDRVTTAVQALKSIEMCFSDLDANVRPKLALQTMVLQWQSSQQ